MCQQQASLSCQCKNTDQRPYLLSKNPDMYAALIHKSPTPGPSNEPSKPTHLSLVINEAKSISKIALPMILTGLLLYCRSMISMLFLGRLSASWPWPAGLLRPVFRVHGMRKSWATMFTDDREIIALTSLVLPIIGLCELGNCPQTTGCGVLRGTAQPKVGANINLGCFYLVGMPVAIGLGFYAGLDFEGLWMGLLAAQSSCAVTMLVVLGRTDWEFQARRAKELTRGDGGGDGDEREKNRGRRAPQR
ncbi:MATE efflux family protein [Actinidia rufa]|uniref:MATE efflux family protein n=1 Tax=Actinidia rufa TaxID=165716 RepID=A0A7J0GX13_9ERIC|nr:MATE efflux family protein [Actinidia rufa]